MMNYRVLFLLLCVLPVCEQAQQNGGELQRLINNRQYVAVINQVGSLTAADSADFNVMYAIGQAYEGLLRYRNAYRFYNYCYRMDTTNVDLLNTLARTAINTGNGLSICLIGLKKVCNLLLPI